MPLSAPDYYAGALDQIRGAYQLFTSAGWILRRCNEVLAEPDLDPVKIYDLASNCFTFRDEANKWLTGANIEKVREELVRLTQSAGKGNVTKTPAEINTDYTQLFAEAGDFLTWANANLPGVGQPVVGAIVTVFRTWPSSSFSIRVTKTAPVTNRVQLLRNTFD